MDVQFPSLILLASFLVIVFLTLKKKSSNKNLNLPPGPWKMPILGNIHNIKGMRPHRALHKLAQTYGPIMHLKLGQLSAVVVSSPELAKEILKTQDVNFAYRPPLLAAEIFGYNCVSIGFSPYGDYWKQLRRICQIGLLNIGRIQSYRSIREEVSSDFAKWVAAREGSVVNLSERLYSTTYDVTSRATLGKTRKDHENLVALIKDVVALAAGFDLADLFPSVKLFTAISRRRIMKLFNQSDVIFDEIINEHKAKALKSGTDDDKKQEDLVDVLLKFQNEELEIPLSTDSIKTVILDMYIGGSDTTGTTMDWAMAEMLRNPDVLKKAQEEVRSIYNEKGYVDESYINELKYLKSVIKETLRMHPPIPLLLPRKAHQACEINGYHIPANTKVMVNAWAVNRDPASWDEPNSFKPERFLDSSIDFKGNNFEYIPFGAGRRICPGISFGVANVELGLAMLLFHFNWKLPEGMKREDIDMSEALGSSTRRKTNLHLIPVVERPVPAAK